MYNKNYTNYNPNRKYAPKRAVKTFGDLEVYQKALEGSVFVCRELITLLKNRKKQAVKGRKSGAGASRADEYTILVEEWIIKNISECALKVPHLIAEAHGKRFGENQEPLKILDEVMIRCNKMVVYLEQTRDILETGIESDRFNEEIKKYFYLRGKVLNLQRAWRKYIDNK